MYSTDHRIHVEQQEGGAKRPCTLICRFGVKLPEVCGDDLYSLNGHWLPTLNMDDMVLDERDILSSLY